jgi:hypothetical protein
MSEKWAQNALLLASAGTKERSASFQGKRA